MSSSSTTPKPYKSRLFNFVNRNYIKINSQINTKFREWGYVIKGGLQGVLLPFVWLWEKTKNIKSFTTSQKATASLPSYVCDEVIVTVKEKMIVEEDFPLLLNHNFQGLASQIKDKKIVAILNNNKIKDIIPTQKQGEIFLLITSIVKTYEDEHNHSNLILWFDKLFAQVEGIFFKRQFIEEETRLNDYYDYSQGKNIDVNEENNFSLQNIIKAAIDYFFSDRKSLHNLKTNRENQTNSLASQQQSNNLLPSSDNQENNLSTFQGIVKQSQETIGNIIPVVKNVGSQIVNQGLNQVNSIAQNIENNVTKTNYDPFQVKLIILAAIEFFFYQNKGKNYLNSHHDNSLDSSFSTNDLFLIEGEIEDPWLSWDDLYGEKENNITINNDDFEEYQIYSLIENQEENPPITNITREKRTSLTIEANNNNQQNIQPLTNEQEEKIEFEIEAKVIEIRYEKHFLEVILEKLDKLILWLEELVLTLIKIIKNT